MSTTKKTSSERLAKIILAPVISEKATFVGEKHNQALFRVMRDATKPEVKAAVEFLFKVEVESVQILNRAGKQKRSGKTVGRKNHVKHAFVCLKPGQEIQFTGGA
ncbi:MAG: 50S ribosomal protein L23 [Burkholderiaceae bacterium]|jgi:large subunit ribosomal protein L23|nr:50S ribosomal protein L23 [Burkholderiaceae bacterium]